MQQASTKLPNDWSRDGRFLLYTQRSPRSHADLYVLPLADNGTPSSTATPFANTEFSEEQGRFSPDAHWIAYASDESGRSEIYIQPFPAPENGGSKTPISRDGGTQPRWRRDGKELFYFSLDGKLMAADITKGRHSKPVSPEHCSNCLLLRSATMNRPCGFSAGMSLPTASGSSSTRAPLHPNPLQWC